MTIKELINILDEDSKYRLSLFLFNSIALAPELYMIINILKISYNTDSKIPLFIIPYVLMFITSATYVDCESETLSRKLKLKGEFYE